MQAKLYSMTVSNPGHTAQLMLAHKRIDTRVVNLMPGMHPAVLWLLGFRRGTVPALLLDDGRRVEGSLEIAQALDAAVPSPPLYPADPVARARVEAAERWGEEVLQNVPRRIARHALRTDRQLRAWFAGEIAWMPAPQLATLAIQPVAALLALRERATADAARANVAGLPATLDRVDALLADGTVGGAQRNAADFQIAPSVRLLAAFDDLTDLVAGRPCDAWARELLPDHPTFPSSRVIRELRAAAGV
jgi:glutathione S-transferase